ncbi:hypothetical protein D3C77_365810 [compost metagenome]
MDFIIVIVTHVRLVTAIEIRIVFRAHVSAAAPVLVADAEVGYLPRLLLSVGLTQLGHRRHTAKSQILHPFGHLLDSTATHISIDIRLTSEHITQHHELMRAEMVILNHTAPVRVDHSFAFFPRADSILPMIFIGKTAARPAEHGNVNLL